MNSIIAVVICGGFGTRLGQALGPAMCKSLLPILGMPALAYVLEALRQANCSQCILSIDRAEIANEVDQIGRASGLAYLMHSDSGQGPTAVTQEASALISCRRFLVLYGHQIIFPDHLECMVDSDADFAATTYTDSSEGVRKIATLNASGYCVSLRCGGKRNPARHNEVYLDKPYVLETRAIQRSTILGSTFDPRTPADASLRPHTILRYAHDILAVPAKFRHEFHYAYELPEIEGLAAEFNRRFGANRSQ